MYKCTGSYHIDPHVYILCKIFKSPIFNSLLSNKSEFSNAAAQDCSDWTICSFYRYTMYKNSNAVQYPVPIK